MKAIRGLLVVIVGAAAIYVGAKLLPPYLANARYVYDMETHAHILHVRPGVSDQQVADAFYDEAQQHGIPLRRQDLIVETDRAGRIARVTADYEVPVDLYLVQFNWHFHPQYPVDKQSATVIKRSIVAAVGLLLGLYWFFKGFFIFRRYRLVADTPLIPIRSMAMGLVQIRGKAVGENTLVSPVGRTPCFFYQVNIERWGGNSSGSGGWSPYLTDAGWARFYLEDQTGKVLIDPRDAKCDMEQTAQVQVAGSDRALLGHAWEKAEPPPDIPGFPASLSELRSYVARVASGTRTALFQGADLAPEGFVGSQQKKSSARSYQLLTILATVFGSRRTGMLGAGSSASPGDYRLTEQCILPDSWCDIVGTCGENSQAQDDSDRMVIARGENAPTFLISHRSEKELEGNLRARAMRLVLGGGFLAVGFAAALLDILGYL